jgi:outer membrane protein assembly factor BamD
MRRVILFISLISLVFLHGCSIFKASEEDETSDWSAAKIYSEGKKALKEEDFETAIRMYERLESRFPFSRYAQQAQLETAYAYYKYEEPESAISAADRFIKLHPRHPNVDYAYYLKGLINFNRNSGILQRLIPQDMSSRDTKTARQAFFDFSTLIRKYPASRYAADARQRMLYLRNSLAAHEIHVARYYIKRGAYVAAVNRCKYVIENYDRSTAVPEALRLMSVAYTRLGMDKLASDAQRVLMASYPDYLKRKKKEKGWLRFLREDEY